MSEGVDLFAEAVASYLRDMRADHRDQGTLARHRARQLLELAGPDADRAAIEAAAAKRFSQMDPARRAALVAFTLELRDAPAGGAGARRIDPSTIPPRRVERKESATMPAPSLRPEQRERVLAIVRRALDEYPDAKPGDVYPWLEREGIRITYTGFRETYWKRVQRERELASKNGKKKATPVARTRAAAEKVECEGATLPRFVDAAEAAPAVRELAMPPVGPGLRITPMVGGEVLVEFNTRVPASLGFRIAAAIGEVMSGVEKGEAA